MGKMDRSIRVAIGLVILGLYFFTGILSGTIGTILLVVAAIFILTSLVSFCPLYSIFGMNTCKTT